MLTEKEKIICKAIVEVMDLENVYSLTQTVTSRNVNVTTIEEAVNAIAMYSRSLDELLRRRKVKREHLFQYVIRREPSLPSTTEKEQLIKKIMEDVNSCDGQENTISQENDIPSSETNKDRKEAQVMDLQPIDGQLLAEKFVPWFFRVFNSLHVDMQDLKDPNASFGEQHFWKESSFTVEYTSQANCEEKTVHGAQLVTEMYTKLVVMDGLLFNPNLSSVQGKIDSHGLASVVVSGTVHRNSDPCGVFEKALGLIRDPLLQNNWKIKYVRLRLKGQVARPIRSIQSF